MKKINYFGFLGFTSILGLLGFYTNNKSMFLYFCFLPYFMYFKVIPDESFKENVRKSATIAYIISFVISCISIGLYEIYNNPSIAIAGLNFSFSISGILFLIKFLAIESKEKKGLE
ncbi:DUF3796 domain-containing protein [[Clostridium] dakarense]|uniref:DUF3796 domain-containing protein n=1 Tax=Faecalimicrobium dakarense TaxID=1301100 RepID=UPI000695095A|nr:DUF3796 domain-containing protein [[Clostridium] dakarense]